MAPALIHGESAHSQNAMEADRERYQQLQLLGQGATAQVFKAFDAKLQRWVALKFLKSADSKVLERALEEARVHAQLEHPNICRIYEAGTGFIAMQLVEGPTLAAASREMSIPQMVQAVRDLTEGVHTAHRRGLVHLDIKPANVLMQRSEQGEWKAVLSDFGMVRSEWQQDAAICPLGTPPFSSPEQVAGDLAAVERRSDIYSLGATLYVLLSNVSPFAPPSPAADPLGRHSTTTSKHLGQDGNLEQHQEPQQSTPSRSHQLQQMMEDIQHKAPTPLRAHRPELSKDLEAIIMKCLAKDPARRYASAMDLALDLDRHLEGLPVQARPLPPWTRLSKAMRRSPRTSLALASAALLLLGTSGFWLWNAYRLQARTYWAQKFGQETIRMESILHSGRMLSLHDTSRERVILRQKMDGIRQEIARDKNASGPGAWALGQGLLLLGEAEKAQAHLEQAIQTGYDLPPVRQALGEALLMRYQTGLQDLGTMDDKELRKKQREKLEREFRTPALWHLLRAKSDQTRSPQEIRLALAEGRLQDAQTLAQAIYGQEPWNYEPLLDVAEAKMLQGQNAVETGQVENAKTHFQEALALLDTPNRIAPSDERIYFLRSRIWHLGFQAGIQGKSKEEALKEGSRWIEWALKANPENFDQSMQKAAIFRRLGREALQNGQDPNPWLDRSDHCCVGQLSRNMNASQIAQLYKKLAENSFERGRHEKTWDGQKAHWAKTTRYARAAVATGKADWEAYRILGRTLAYQAYYAQRATGSPGQESAFPLLEEAEKQLERGVEINSNPAIMYTTAWAYLQDAILRCPKGMDPTEKLKKGDYWANKVLSINPKDGKSYILLSWYRSISATWANSQNQDPFPLFKESFAFLQRAKECNTGTADYWNFKTGIHLEKARVHLDRGEDAEKEIKAAEECVRNYCTLPGTSKSSGEGDYNRHLCLLLRARMRLSRVLPLLDLRQGDSHTNPMETAQVRTAEIRGTLAIWEGWEQLQERKSAMKQITKSRNILNQWIKAEPDKTEAKLLQIRLHLLETTEAWRKGKNTEHLRRSTQNKIDEIIGIAPEDIRLHFLIGCLDMLSVIIENRVPISNKALDTLSFLQKKVPGNAETKSLRWVASRKQLSAPEQNYIRATDPMLYVIHKWIILNKGNHSKGLKHLSTSAL